MFYFNGKKVTQEQMLEMLDASQHYMLEESAKIKVDNDVSIETADAICYLRTRSRWTQEKENDLIAHDKAGNPIPLNTVLSGEF